MRMVNSEKEMTRIQVRNSIQSNMTNLQSMILEMENLINALNHALGGNTLSFSQDAMQCSRQAKAALDETMHQLRIAYQLADELDTTEEEPWSWQF